MKYLKIQNTGELDVRLISLMGGSTKSEQTYKIGRFGTGLKYTLSFLVRNNIDFKIFIGENQVDIKPVTEHIQGTDFDILYINGERSSITSSMGVDWEAWMIVREIWCNAVDEGGAVKDITDDLVGAPNTTTFFIQLTGEIKKVVDSWSQYFMDKTDVIFETKRFKIYPAREHFCIYKQGVLIYQDVEYKSVFSYDILDASINELREYKGYLPHDMFNVIRLLDAKRVDYFLSHINEDCFEDEMDYNWSEKLADSWKEAIGEAKIISREDFDNLQAKGVKLDGAKYVKVSKSLAKKLATDMPHVSALRVADKVNSFFQVVCEETDNKIKKGLAILETCNYYIDPELKWMVGIFGDGNVWAKVNRDEKLIMFSQDMKDKSLFDTITTIIEENEHFKTEFADETRAFQQHFINLYTSTLLKLNQIDI